MSRRRQHFRRIIVLDFEYEIEDGGLPNVLCLVAYILDEQLADTLKPSDAGAASSALRRHSISTTTRWSSVIRYGPR